MKMRNLEKVQGTIYLREQRRAGWGGDVRTRMRFERHKRESLIVCLKEKKKRTRSKEGEKIKI